MYQEVLPKERNEFDKLAGHPLQSWAWGEFREKTGVKMVRLAKMVNGKLNSPLQIFFHKLPLFNYTVGYVPKGPLPDKEMIEALISFGKKHMAIFIQLEPNVTVGETKILRYEDIKKKNNNALNIPISQYPNIFPSARPLFTKYTFVIDLNKTEDELLKSFSSKTRYNIRLAQKHGVTIQEENSEEAFNRYLELTRETTRRQGFYAHDENYHLKMWTTLRQAQDKTLRQAQDKTLRQAQDKTLQLRSGNDKPIAHLLTARYQNQILVTWILFLFNGVLYYPYGASSNEHKQVMASNLMMWEAIKFGKKHDAKSFDLWGTPGPDPKPEDPYFGFHKFKLGYSPKLVEFVGSYDLVLNPVLYNLFNLINQIRWTLLKAK